MLNEVALVKVSDFKREGQEADKNGVQNVFLSPVAGKIPNWSQVIAGTVAQGNGLISGNLQLVMITEGKETEVNGELRRQFNVTVLDADVSGKDVINLRKELSAGYVIPMTATAVEAEKIEKPNTATSNLGPKKEEKVN